MELLIYIAIVVIGYVLWVKIKAFFTGRTWNEQVEHDEARKAEQVCRNCRHCWGTKCLVYDCSVDPDYECCDDFKR